MHSYALCALLNPPVICYTESSEHADFACKHPAELQFSLTYTSSIE